MNGRLVTNGSMSSGVIKTGMEGASLLDAGMPEYLLLLSGELSEDNQEQKHTDKCPP